MMMRLPWIGLMSAMALTASSLLSLVRADTLIAAPSVATLDEGPRSPTASISPARSSR
jgi:hypothetical protein